LGNPIFRGKLLVLGSVYLAGYSKE